MNGYKTGGDWTDVTNISRNEVVFEGRHKAYGAYYIRQRYPNALYLSFLFSITIIALCAFIPYVLHNKNHEDIASKTNVIAKVIDFIIPPKIIPPPITHTTVQPPKTSPVKNAAPVITPKQIDSLPKPDDKSLLATTHSTTQGDDKAAIEPETGGSILPVIPENDKPLLWVSEMPKFSKGSLEDYLRNNTNYTHEESQSGLQGTVYVTFVVEKDGSVGDVALLQGIPHAQELNREALRVISEMPKWTPGKQDGHPVRIQFRIPIRFELH